MDHLDTVEEMREFVVLLRQLTETGVAEWALCDEPGYAHCLVGEDLLVFEMLGGQEAEHVSAERDVEGIEVRFRNVPYLFLTTMEDGQKLLALVRAAPVDRGLYYELKKRARSCHLGILRRAAQQNN